MIERVAPTALKAMLSDGAELAIVDVREQGIYFTAHLLFAVCIPLSRLEILVRDLIPRRSTRLVLCDAGDDHRAERAAALLQRNGYSALSILHGGVAAWREGGYEIFSGINVPSKAFGEYIEHRYDTPRISATDLAARRAAGDDLVVLDSRPLEEFRNVSIPGGIDCPGAELVYRVFDMAPNPRTTVVVNCAGRTRSIIGAQSLINAGIPNPVLALKDGTMGWQLAGLQAQHGHAEHAPPPSPAGLAQAQSAAAGVAQRFGVRRIDRTELRRLQTEADTRTLYLLDVRTAEEYAAGHLAGSRHAPGGQLVQATDEFAATRHSRIVLIDDNGVRATMTASWLWQLGWDEVYVLHDGLAEEAELAHSAYRPTLLEFTAQPTILGADLHAELATLQRPSVLDFGTSLQYRRGHIPGAAWCLRSELAAALGVIDQAQCVVSSPDGILAHYCAREIAAARPDLNVRVLHGGTAAWTAAGLPLETGSQRLSCEPKDIWYKPYEQSESTTAMQDYLTWEVNLVEQIARDGDARFR